MSHEHELMAAEAYELHEWLTSKGIPTTEKSEDGKLVDDKGNKCYLLPLIDRVIIYGERQSLALKESEVCWTPLNLQDPDHVSNFPEE